MTTTAIVAPTAAPPAATGSLASVIDALEANLAKKPPLRTVKAVQTVEDLLPVVLADRVVWRHLVSAEDTLLAALVIADALDDAYGLIGEARRQAPQPWQLLQVQAAAYTTLRATLGGVAEALAWAFEVAQRAAIAMTVRVGRTYERNQLGRRVPLSTVTLTLHT